MPSAPRAADGTDKPFPGRDRISEPAVPGASLSPAPVTHCRHQHIREHKSGTIPLSHSLPRPCEVTASSDERKTELSCKRALMSGLTRCPAVPSHTDCSQCHGAISVCGLRLLNLKLQKRARGGVLRTQPSLENGPLGKGRGSPERGQVWQLMGGWGGWFWGGGQQRCSMWEGYEALWEHP